MAKTVGVRKLIQLLRHAGFIEYPGGNGGARHRKFRHPSGRMVTLPKSPKGDCIHGFMASRALRFIREVQDGVV